MKLSQYSIFFAVILGTSLFIIGVHTALLQYQSIESAEMERAVSVSTDAALAKADIDEKAVFTQEKARKNAVNAFYQQLNKSLGYSGSREQLSFTHVPFVVLVDNDGYYVSYQTVDYDKNGSPFDGLAITNLRTYSTDYNGYNVRFYLDNMVDVTTSSGLTYSGTYTEVYAMLSNPVALNFMSDKNSFLDEKRSSIVTVIQEELVYLIKNLNTKQNDHNREYDLALPATDDDNEARLLDSPSVIAFFQGAQKGSTKGYINVYAFSGSILDDVVLYYEKEDSRGNLYYHEKGCAELGADEEIEGKIMEDCAKDGAIPCPDCVK